MATYDYRCDSDGVFEFRTKDEELFTIDDLLLILEAPEDEGVPETVRIEREIRERLDGETFPDDFSLLVVEFP